MLLTNIKNLKKIAQEIKLNIIKSSIFAGLALYWSVIIVGTFLQF